MKKEEIKYNKTTILNTGKPVKYLLFWGHTPSKDGSITKSCFSQWFHASFEENNYSYATAEHYMMAKKAVLFNDQEILKQILSCTSSGAAKKLGRMVKNFDNAIWENNRFEIVKQANYLKFTQNKELNIFLKQTKNRVLVEESPHDAIWGIGLDQHHNHALNPKKWRGLNLLGFALMEVRDLLNNRDR